MLETRTGISGMTFRGQIINFPGIVFFLFFLLFIAAIALSAEEGPIEFDPELSIDGVINEAPRFDDFDAVWEPSWVLRPDRRFTFDFENLVVAAIVAFCGLAFFVCLRGIRSVIAETAAIRLDAAALITGDFMPL